MQTNKNKLNQKLMLYSVDKFYLLCYNSNVITKLKHWQTGLILRIFDTLVLCLLKHCGIDLLYRIEKTVRFQYACL